jgi:uncharacterized RDD family membrane protein YckC
MTSQDPGGPGGDQSGAPPPPPAPPPPAFDPGPPPSPWAPPEASTSYAVPGVPGLRYGAVLGRFLAYWLDSILVGIGAGFIAGLIGAIAGRGGTGDAVTIVVFIGLDLLYFVGFWTGGSRATLAMRLMKLQVGNATDGATLTVGQGIVRWIALDGVVQGLALLPPALAGLGALGVLWLIALLVSTLVSPTRRGIHDRLAGSVMVQPEGASTPVVACLVLLVLLLVVPLIAIVALIFLGGQVSDILSQVGRSI